MEKDNQSEASWSLSSTTDFQSQSDDEDASTSKCGPSRELLLDGVSLQSLAGDAPSAIDFSLVVRTTVENGSVRTARIRLVAIDGVQDLGGLFYRLLTGAFPMHNPMALPDYLVSNQYCKFTPAEEFVSLSGDIVHTHFCLVAKMNGWEFTIAERALGSPPDPHRRFVVTVAEFESRPVDLPDGRKLVVSLVAFPTVSVHRDFLLEALGRFVADLGTVSTGSVSSAGMVCVR